MRNRETGHRSARKALAVVFGLPALLLVLACAAIAGADGFGSGGRLVTSFGSYPEASVSVTDLAVAPDGRSAVVLEGASGQPIQVAVLEADGATDRSFSGDGLVAPQLEPGRPFRREPVKVAFDSGSLLVAGTVRGPQGEEVELRKYSPDGSLDRGFGKDGVATTTLPGVADLFVEPDGAIALFADGHRVPGLGMSAGGLVLFGPQGTPGTPVLPSGVGGFGSVTMSADGGFLAEAGNGEEPFASTVLRLGPEGQILHQASFTESQAFVRHVIGQGAEGAALAEVEDHLVRLEADDATPDPSFHGELAPCPHGAGDYDGALPEPSGKVILFGSCGLARIQADGEPDPAFAPSAPAGGALQNVALGSGGSVLYATADEAGAAEVVRLGAEGSPDPGFGEGGRVRIRPRAPASSGAGAVIAMPGGGFLVAGRAARGPGEGGFALARYDSAGDLVKSFGEGGRVLDGEHGLRGARAVALTPHGDIVAAGLATPGGSGGTVEPAFALAEFRPSGKPDRSFGEGGTVVAQISPGRGQRSEIEDVAVQPDGRIVVAGLSEGCGRHGGVCFTVARFLPSGAIDRSFARAGVLRLPGTRGEATALALARDGKIVVTGGEGGSFLTIRLNRRGRLDPSFGHRGIVDRQEQIRFHERGREVIDLGLGSDAVAVSSNGFVTVAGGSRSGHSVIERYGPGGAQDRRFGDGGRVLLPHLGVSDLAISRCGIVAVGTTKAPEREPQMSVVGIGVSGQRPSRPRPLFGALRASYGIAVALDHGRALVAGEVRAFEASSEIGVATVALRLSSTRCRAVGLGRP